MIQRILCAASLIITSTLIAGCFEIEERVSIAPTGESSMVFKLRMSTPEDSKSTSDDINKKLDGVGKGVDGVTIAEMGAKDIFGQKIFSFGLKAPSMKAMQRAYSTFPKEEKKGDAQKDALNKNIDSVFSEKGFYSVKSKGKNLLITRTFGSEVKAKKKKGKKDEMQGFAEMMNMMTGGAKFRFDLEVPTKVISSNAESVDGNILHWVIPFEYIQRHKVVLTAEIESTPELTKALGK